MEASYDQKCACGHKLMCRFGGHSLGHPLTCKVCPGVLRVSSRRKGCFSSFPMCLISGISALEVIEVQIETLLSLHGGYHFGAIRAWGPVYEVSSEDVSRASCLVAFDGMDLGIL